MLKVIALAGVFVLTSAVSTAAVTATKKTSSKVAPSSPQPQGFCYPGTC